MTHTAGTARRPAGFSVEDILGGDRNLIGLARVSTDGEDAELQHDASTAPDAAGLRREGERRDGRR